MTRWMPVLAVICAPTLLQAATIELTYTGATYDQTTYHRSNKTPVDPGDVMGPYSTSDKISGTIILEGLMPKNAMLFIDEDGVTAEDLTTGNTLSDINFMSMSFSDGLDTFGVEDLAFDAMVEIDAAGDILSWDLYFLPSLATGDSHTLVASSYVGDAASFTSEFLTICSPGEASVPGSLCEFGPTSVGIEQGSARAAALGSWNVSAVVAVVPLPAGSLLLLTGLGAFALSRRRAR